MGTVCPLDLVLQRALYLAHYEVQHVQIQPKSHKQT